MFLKSHRIKPLLKVLLMVVEATILAIILSFIIIEFVSLDVFLSFLFFPEDINIPFPFNLCGIPVIILGCVLIVWANYTLLFVGKIGLDAREPFQTPPTLVTEGPYKFSRNPLYLSIVFVGFGLALLMSSITVFILTIALFFIFQKWFVSWEEKKLEGVFGEEYQEYKRRVRRWL